MYIRRIEPDIRSQIYNFLIIKTRLNNINHVVGQIEFFFFSSFCNSYIIREA